MVQSTEIQFIGRILRRAWLRRWWLLGIVTLTTVASAGLFFLIPRHYRSETIISVEREKVINPLSNQVRGGGNENEERLKTLNQEIHSRTLIEKLLLKLGLESPGIDPLLHERNIREISDSTTVTLSRFDSFKVSYEGKDPGQVRDITNALAGIFIQENLAFKEGEADSTYSFLTQQLEVYRKKLEDSEIALRQFEEKHLEVLPEAKTTNQARLDMLKVNLDGVRQTLNQERIQKDLLIKRIPGGQGARPADKGASTMVPNPLISTLQEKEDELQRLRQEYSDRYPDVIRVQGEIEALKKEIALNPTVAASSIPLGESEIARQSIWEQIRKLDVDIEALKDREVQLEREIARYQERVQTIPQVEQELSRLRRDYNVNSDIYDMFLRRVEEARVTRELESSKKREVFRVLEPAVLPLLPYKPNRTLVVLGGLAAGLGLGLLLVYLQVIHDTSFQGLDDARKFLPVPVLGGIQWTREAAALRWRKVDATLYSLLVALLLAATAAFILWRQVSGLIRGGQP